MTNKIKQVETANFGRLGWGGAVFKWRAIPVLHKGWNLTLFSITDEEAKMLSDSPEVMQLLAPGPDWQ